MNVWLLMQAFALLLGLCLGSFLNVCIARMPEDRSVVHPGSACPHCGAPIRWHDNIPILSWLLLRARCRDCGHPISATYPLIEAATGLLVLLVWIQTVPGVEALDAAHLAAFAYRSVFVCALVGLTFIDIEHHIIPDEFSIYAVPVGVLGALGIGLLHPGLAPSWQQSLVGALLGAAFLMAVAGGWSLVQVIRRWIPAAWSRWRCEGSLASARSLARGCRAAWTGARSSVRAFLSAFAGAGALVLEVPGAMATAWSRRRHEGLGAGALSMARDLRAALAAAWPRGRERMAGCGEAMLSWWPDDAMGFGDVKLLAMIGSFLGAFPALVLVLLLGSIAGSVVGIATMVRRSATLRLALPFGPFLALGAMLALFFGGPLLRLWLLGLPGVIR